MRIIMCVLLALFLSGCAGGQVSIPASMLIDGAVDMAPLVADASTVKEAVVHRSIRNYQKEYSKSFKDSGVKIKFEIVKLSESLSAYLPADITIRGEVKMGAPPAAPSEHPVWRTINNVFDTGLKYGFGYLGVDAIVGGFKSMNDNAGHKFYRDADIDGSFGEIQGDSDLVISTEYHESQIDDSNTEAPHNNTYSEPEGK